MRDWRSRERYIEHSRDDRKQNQAKGALLRSIYRCRTVNKSGDTPVERKRMGISVNGPSGIDTASLIEQLVELEYTNKVDPIEEKQEAYQVSIDAYSKLKSLISDLSTQAGNIDELKDFNEFITGSSDEDAATISGSTDCQTGTYSLEIFHLATNEKLVSGNNLISSQTASLSSMGITTGTISINGTEITVDDDDTIQDLRAKINDATDTDGESIGVTASVLRVSDGNYRLVLTSDDSGANGAEYRDVSGSLLQNLGIISSADGDKGITHQRIGSDAGVEETLSGLAVDSTIRISGKDHDGNEIAGMITVSEEMSGEDFLKEIEELYNGTVTASFESDGSLSISDKIGGSSQMELSFDSFGSTTPPAITCTIVGQSGKSVLSCGSDAFLSIDGINVSSASNSVDDAIAGATITLKDTTDEKSVELSVERDVDTLAGKITKLVDSYNTLYNWVEEQTSYAVNNDEEEGEESENGSLAGDMTVDTIMNKISSVFRKQFTSATGKYHNLNSIGISTDSSSGELNVDADKLKKALTANMNDVMNLFVTDGRSSASGITLGRSDSSTQSGEYELEKTESGYRIRLDGSTAWYEAASITGEIVEFDDGPAAGLFLTVPASSLATGESATFTYSRGFGDMLKDLADQMTDGSSASDGLIALRQKSLNKNIDSANDRIESLTTQIENYRERLTRQYAAMEEALNTMETQMSSMLSALGISSS